ncbi:hypothetical protein AAFF_G00219450 [Aldrovandia affinis]|uniref:BZIP domain-containing protein n=1 Tax=Aldrovandia affinis TaxID=143900 RepID=A0AAD7W4Z8_9TELE|nr:hypothetical protein AAFF_G00219450 [Aldrovandia affinis]
MELLDLLFDQTDGILRHEELGRHGNQLWPIPEQGVPMAANATDDFLNVLLQGADSVPGARPWPPSPSDSGISEDPHSDQMDSPHPLTALPWTPTDPAPRHNAPNRPWMPWSLTSRLNCQSASERTHIKVPCVPADGWPSGFFPNGVAEKQPASECELHNSQMSPGFSLTVKDLLLSNSTDNSQQPSQQSFQELILNEDEKKLLAKEGMTLPSQLPLTKYEERILKKIRRKIRNKQSAQESRKKKKEYIDGLESRMAACSAQNHELQRKVFQLEKRNTSLMEQLRRLQSLVMNRSNKTAQTGTCILVLVLSFSLILLPSLQPFSDSKVNQETSGGDFSPVRVQSRSLSSLQSSRVLHVHFAMEEEPRARPQPARDEGVEEITSLLANSDLIPHNTSLEERVRHHGDPITGRIATVTLSSGHDTPLRSYADDM